MAWQGTKTFTTNSYYNPEETNRENENTEYLAQEINNKIVTINLPEAVKQDYNRLNFPYVGEINKLKTNIKFLIANLPISENPALTVSLTRLQSFNYIEANKLERNLQNIYDIIQNIEGYFRYCGTFYCGEVNNGLY